MFIGVSHKAGTTATILFAMPPMARLKILGLRDVSPEIVEAGLMAGCTRLQMLRKVEIPAARATPMAFPEIMLGVNQTIMFALFMVIIARSSGRATSARRSSALTFNDAGKGLLVGLCVAFMGLAADRLITEWAAARKRELGIEQPVQWPQSRGLREKCPIPSTSFRTAVTPA